MADIPETSSSNQTYKLNCTLLVDDTPIPLQAIYQDGKNLTLMIDAEAIHFGGLGDLEKIVGGSANLSLPTDFESLRAISLNQFELEVKSNANNTKHFERMSFGFGATQSRSLLPGIFTLESLDVSIQIFNPLSDQQNFSGSITGALKLGETEVQLASVRQDQESPWAFTSSIPKISLSDLATQALSQFSLPISIPEISFVDTQVTIIPSQDDYQFETQTASDSLWSLPFGANNIEYGLGSILDVKRARFEGALDVVQGGAVDMALDLVLMKNDTALNLAFNFGSPKKAAETLVRNLLAEIG